MTEPVQREQGDLRSLLRALWRRKWLFLAVLFLIPGAVFAISSLVPKTFESTTLIRVKTPSLDIPALGSGSLSAVETEALLFETQTTAEEAAKELGLPASQAGSLIGSIRVAPVATSSGGVTELVQLTGQAEDARQAAAIANAYASAIDTVRSRQALRQIDRAVANLEAQQADAKDDLATEAELARQLQLLRSARLAARENTETIQPALPPDTPISPHPRRNTALAGLVALLLALGAVAGVERLDRRLRDSSELEPLLGAPLLSVIPRGAFPGAKPSPGPVREAFRTLAASLVYFNIDHPVTTVMVTSPTQGDGKTTVSVHLAVALAKDGARVILVDGDLRHPQVAIRLGIESSVGLAQVVSGQVAASDGLVDVGVGEGEEGRLQVLAAGDRPPNPGRLLGSDRMGRLLTELSSMADIVILDTPPILNVSDAVPLLERVSGIVFVAKVGQTSRDALKRARQVLETARGTLLGGVATGAAAAGLYGYGTDYYAAEPEPEPATGEPRRADEAVAAEISAEPQEDEADVAEAAPEADPDALAEPERADVVAREDKRDEPEHEGSGIDQFNGGAIERLRRELLEPGHPSRPWVPAPERKRPSEERLVGGDEREDPESTQPFPALEDPVDRELENPVDQEDLADPAAETPQPAEGGGKPEPAKRRRRRRKRGKKGRRG